LERGTISSCRRPRRGWPYHQVPRGDVSPFRTAYELVDFRFGDIAHSDDHRHQKQAFPKGEGDAYLRNAGRERIGDDDPVVRVVRQLKLGGTSVLEVGCVR
jgi:hypothetical protein